MSTPILSVPTSIAMARGPVFVTGKNNTLAADSLDEMSCNLYVYTGLSTVPGSADYQLIKSYSIDEVINFEISNLIRDQFFHDFGIWHSIGYEPSPEGEVLWVAPTGYWNYSDNGTVPVSGNWGVGTAKVFMALEGWSPDLNNPAVTTKLLSVSRNRYVYPDNFEVLAFRNQDVAEIEIAWSNGDADAFYTTPTNLAPPAAGTESTLQVVYAGVGPANLENNPYIDNVIKPSNHEPGEYYDVVFKTSLGVELFRQRYTLVCEPKYTPYQVAFVNRYGVLDYLTFFKNSTETGSFTSESFKRSIYNDGFTVPSTQVSQYTNFNINSRNELQLNTGWVDQDYNDVMEDLLMSETCAILLQGEWWAVTPSRGSFEYKKELNGLINYTLSFQIGFNQRALVR